MGCFDYLCCTPANFLARRRPPVLPLNPYTVYDGTQYEEIKILIPRSPAYDAPLSRRRTLPSSGPHHFLAHPVQHSATSPRTPTLVLSPVASRTRRTISSGGDERILSLSPVANPRAPIQPSGSLGSPSSARSPQSPRSIRSHRSPTSPRFIRSPQSSVHPPAAAHYVDSRAPYSGGFQPNGHMRGSRVVNRQSMYAGDDRAFMADYESPSTNQDNPAQLETGLAEPIDVSPVRYSQQQPPPVSENEPDTHPHQQAYTESSPYPVASESEGDWSHDAAAQVQLANTNTTLNGASYGDQPHDSQHGTAQRPGERYQSTQPPAPMQTTQHARSDRGSRFLDVAFNSEDSVNQVQINQAPARYSQPISSKPERTSAALPQQHRASQSEAAGHRRESLRAHPTQIYSAQRDRNSHPQQSHTVHRVLENDRPLAVPRPHATGGDPVDFPKKNNETAPTSAANIGRLHKSQPDRAVHHVVGHPQYTENVAARASNALAKRHEDVSNQQGDSEHGHLPVAHLQHPSGPDMHENATKEGRDRETVRASAANNTRTHGTQPNAWLHHIRGHPEHTEKTEAHASFAPADRHGGHILHQQEHIANGHLPAAHHEQLYPAGHERGHLPPVRQEQLHYPAGHDTNVHTNIAHVGTAGHQETREDLGQAFETPHNRIHILQHEGIDPYHENLRFYTSSAQRPSELHLQQHDGLSRQQAPANPDHPHVRLRGTQQVASVQRVMGHSQDTENIEARANIALEERHEDASRQQGNVGHVHLPVAHPEQHHKPAGHDVHANVTHGGTAGHQETHEDLAHTHQYSEHHPQHQYSEHHPQRHDGLLRQPRGDHDFGRTLPSQILRSRDEQSRNLPEHHELARAAPPSYLQHAATATRDIRGHHQQGHNATPRRLPIANHGQQHVTHHYPLVRRQIPAHVPAR
ncbi:MAG: hypothetical protein CYPHOPRED_000644 [Cyphobasidiales sp. Tagirdzhanova-0007]|nr:MAG: hypothetical protein CYPHOPRED_000644 [Cyphobasidiales sp. Tagirdzhanova-0007]